MNTVSARLLLRWSALCVVLLWVSSLAPSAGAADEPQTDRVKEERRRDLLQRARASVDPETLDQSVLADLQRTLATEGSRWERFAPDAIPRARLLVGSPERSGLLREGAALSRWLTRGEGVRWFLLREPEPPRRERMRLAMSPSGPVQWRDGAEAPLDEVPLDEAALAQLAQFELDVERRSDRQIVLHDANGADAIPLLRTIEAAYPLAPPPNARRDWTPAPAPLVIEELQAAHSRTWLALRRLQSEERRRRWSEERPVRGLEDEERVARRAARRTRSQAEVERLLARRERVRAALDQMVDVEARAITDAGTRAFQMESMEAAAAAAKAATAPAPTEGATSGEGAALLEAGDDHVPAPEAPVDPELEKLRVLQWVGQQELRLLYITARRTSERAAILDEAIAIAREEERVAAEVAALFDEELNRMRRERQLGRLQADAYDLERDRRDAEDALASADERGTPLWAARIAAYEPLQTLNGVLRELVGMRQEIERVVNPQPASPAGVPAAAAATPPVAPTAPPVPSPPPANGSSASAPNTQSPKTEEDATTRALETLAGTNANGLGRKRVALALELLDRLPASTVASLHAAADERLEAFAALDGFRGRLLALDARAQTAQAVAEAALRTLEQRASGTWHTHAFHARRMRRNLLEPHATAVRSTREGIERELATAAEQRTVLASFRTQLGNLGTRSLAIRARRTLTTQELERAAQDIDRFAGDTKLWVLGRGDSHVGTFLQKHGWLLAACLVVLAATWLGARWGRRAIDRWLDRQSAVRPELRRADATVKNESAEARLVKERLEAEHRAVEAAALESASGDGRVVPSAAPAAPAADAAAPNPPREEGKTRGSA